MLFAESIYVYSRIHVSIQSFHEHIDSHTNSNCTITVTQYITKLQYNKKIIFDVHFCVGGVTFSFISGPTVSTVEHIRHICNTLQCYVLLARSNQVIYIYMCVCVWVYALRYVSYIFISPQHSPIRIYRDQKFIVLN